jgi:hypothetical protein|tara:strand:+ start:257 stop:457 length:201 start_codon:yes stop_codon:yes gene_type:complete
MCSLAYNECTPSWEEQDQIKFVNYSDCQIYGNRLSIGILEELGKDVDRAKIRIHFKCEELKQRIKL